ncbi:hypothetical protein [Natrarchaeobaculum aegyptiacum]|uniref:DUF8159 domain-containing protein n=1 Tax=Natrarchaeobaculum aegyptiacum TaxID=745377 RepID=A0A2Z2HSC5_9EURY|nr:hypothetical protein [Natrarchaeobaculum aegyptiacum]ARS90116.1 hypothetical protein B1756_10505 [Natrarchaeobaculum aegyptiacum]
MERRKILLGSGAAFATVLAGCSSTETDEDVPDDSGTDDTSGFDDDGGSDDSDTGGDDDGEDLPGVEGVTDLESDHLSVVDVQANPDTLGVYVETDTTDTQKLHDELAYVADDLSKAIVDRDRFKSEIESIELVVEHSGARVFEVYIDVQWLLDYLDEYITREELKHKVVDTKH